MHSPLIRPRSAIEIVDASVSLYRDNFRTMAVIGLAASLPLVVAVGMRIGVFGIVANPQQFYAHPLTFLPDAVGFALIALVWFAVVDGAMTFAAAEAYHGRTPTPADAIRGALGRGMQLVGGNLLRMLLVGGFAVVAAIGVMVAARSSGLVAVLIAILLLVLAAMLLARTFAITSAIVIEDRSATEGMQRSFFLSKDAVLRIIGVALLCGVIYMVARMVFVAIVQMLVMLVVKAPVLAAVLGVIAGMMIYPFLNIAIMVLYFDQRVRKEGYDLDVMGISIPVPVSTS